MKLKIKGSINRVLSATPSIAIRQAVKDLLAVEKDSKFEVSMNDWHKPVIDRVGSRCCEVCFAGSVLYRIFKNPNLDLFPSSFEDSHPDFADRLRGLNQFRAGCIFYGLRDFNKELPKNLRERRKIPDYAFYPGQFKKAMLKLADDLQVRGL